jgi:hypothetical protein
MCGLKSQIMVILSQKQLWDMWTFPKKHATRFEPVQILVEPVPNGGPPTPAGNSGAFCRPGKVAEGTKKLGRVDVLSPSPDGTSSPFLVGSWRGRRPDMTSGYSQDHLKLMKQHWTPTTKYRFIMVVGYSYGHKNQL